MKIRSFSSAIILVAAIFGLSPMQASVVRNAGETTITLDIGFGIRTVLPSRVTVPPTEHLTIVAPQEISPGGVWTKDGRPIPGATDRVLIIDVAQPSDSGSYKFDFSGFHIPESGSQLLFLEVRPATTLVNLSTRGFAGQGDQTLIGGFIVSGKSATSGQSTVLIRAVGPTLARFGVSGVLNEPKIMIFSADGTPYTTEFHYPSELGYISREQHIQAITTKVGAFPLDAGAKDAVELRPFPPGVYTVHVTGVNGSTGNVLLETYESPE